VKVVVPDASVLLKWVLPGPDEEDRDAALRLRDAGLRGEVILMAPSLWLYEVGNALTRRFPEHAGALLDVLVAYEIEEGITERPWRQRAIDLVRRYGVTFYDAAYHALALVEDGLFVTADARYMRQVAEVGGVQMLHDYR
jgi:predicted nucleic acid-binding protein